VRDLVKLIRLLFWATVAAAIYQELRKPPTARTWHGKVAGIVPYDFRIPTLERLLDAYWSPDSDVVFSEHVWGVGWAINIPVFTRKTFAAARQYFEASREAAERLRPADDGSDRPAPRVSRPTT
jgi:hypothetical protein